MSEQQRTLSGYKSRVHEQEDFENPNQGKPLLDDVTEYVLRLYEMPRLFPKVVDKKLPDGSIKKVTTEKAICVFEEEQTKNQVTTTFRVDSLNFSKDESYESAVIKFFKKIKTPLVEGECPVWENYFVVGMRIRGRVVVKPDVDKDNLPVVKYFLDVPTCRPILQSDMHPEASATLNTPKTDAKPVYSPSDLANALLLAKGAKTNSEAMDKLKAADATKDIVMALFNADLDGRVTYPI